MIRTIISSLIYFGLLIGAIVMFVKGIFDWSWIKLGGGVILFLLWVGSYPFISDYIFDQ